ncbi:MAG: DNA repair protein rad52 [Cirrosporium novae-zelandiae]|nr:MAG: DNA repair protein rad52 [Cirrosporium novae-zelandiae]
MPAVGDQHLLTSHAGANPFEEVKPHMSEYTAQDIARLQSRLEKQLGPEYLSSRAGPGGQKLHYVAAEKCIGLANEVFGFNGWSSAIKETCIDFLDENEHTGKVSLGISVIVRVTLKDGTYHEDVGYGHIENCKGKAPAFEKAKKEGTTDALKRALRNFGNVLGNCIYDKEYLKKVTKMKVTPSKWDSDNLYRHSDFAPIKKEPIADEPTNNTGESSKNGGPTNKGTIDQSSYKMSTDSFSEFDDDFIGDEFEGVDLNVSTNDGNPDEVALDALPTPNQAPINRPMQPQPNNFGQSHNRAPISRVQSVPNFSSGSGITPNQSHGASSFRRPGDQNPQTPSRQGNPMNVSSRPNMGPPQTNAVNGRPQQPHPQTYNSNQAGRSVINPAQGHHSLSNGRPQSTHNDVRASPSRQPPHALSNNARLQQNHNPPRLTPPNAGPQGAEYNLRPQPNHSTNRLTPPNLHPHQQPYQSNQPNQNPPAPLTDPPVGFFSARSATAVLGADNTSPTVFNPKLESPSIRKTAGVNHDKTVPVERSALGLPPKQTTNPGGAPPARAPTGTTNFVNPSLDPNRRIGAPGGMGMSPLANRSSYRPPTMHAKRPASTEAGAGGRLPNNGNRPPLGDVTAGVTNHPITSNMNGHGSEIKRQKTGPGYEVQNPVLRQ